MKTLRTLFPAILLAVSAACPAIAAMPGDLNGDGKVNISDVTLSLRAAVGLYQPTPDALAAGDVSPRPGTNGRLYGDGVVNIQDVLRILRYVVGLLSDDQFAPVESTTLYTLNGRAPLGVDGSATAVDLAAFLADHTTGIMDNAFAVGSAPNQMVIRGNLGYLVNSGSNTLQVINLDTKQTDGASVSTGDGTNPYQVALVGNKAYVSLLVTNQVAVIDLDGRKVLGTINAGNSPAGVVASQNRVYVACSNYNYDPSTQKVVYRQGTVSIIDPRTDQVVKTINVATNPQDMAVDSFGRVHVVCTGDYSNVKGAISVISPATDEVVGTVALGGTPGNIAINFLDQAYCTDSSHGLVSYDARTLEVRLGPGQAIPFAGSALDVTADARGRIYACDFQKDLVKVVDPATNTVLAEIPVGAGPEGLAIR
ncbi:MAG TPA: dockerin type I domain-containing protein [Armatimonadota bacterium]|jgi:YVTN family beta-propeller protein